MIRSIRLILLPLRKCRLFVVNDYFHVVKYFLCVEKKEKIISIEKTLKKITLPIPLVEIHNIEESVRFISNKPWGYGWARFVQIGIFFSWRWPGISAGKDISLCAWACSISPIIRSSCSTLITGASKARIFIGISLNFLFYPNSRSSTRITTCGTWALNKPPCFLRAPSFSSSLLEFTNAIFRRENKEIIIFAEREKKKRASYWII